MNRCCPTTTPDKLKKHSAAQPHDLPISMTKLIKLKVVFLIISNRDIIKKDIFQKEMWHCFVFFFSCALLLYFLVFPPFYFLWLVMTCVTLASSAYSVLASSLCACFQPFVQCFSFTLPYFLHVIILDFLFLTWTLRTCFCFDVSLPLKTIRHASFTLTDFTAPARPCQHFVMILNGQKRKEPGRSTSP